MNAPFTLDDYIQPTSTTCPDGVANGQPGGCTRDLVHRFYQEQFQLNGGRQDRYVTGSDALGLTMGATTRGCCRSTDTCTRTVIRTTPINDAFFQSAFGGSFLNHQWLIAAATPIWPNAVNDGSAADLHSVIDVNGMPANYPFVHVVSGRDRGEGSPADRVL